MRSQAWASWNFLLNGEPKQDGSFDQGIEACRVRDGFQCSQNRDTVEAPRWYSQLKAENDVLKKLTAFPFSGGLIDEAHPVRCWGTEFTPSAGGYVSPHDVNNKGAKYVV